jgi:hypothetical protein
VAVQLPSTQKTIKVLPWFNYSPYHKLSGNRTRGRIGSRPVLYGISDIWGPKNLSHMNIKKDKKIPYFRI